MTKSKNKLFLLLVIFLALIVRLYGLGTRPFDGDEGIMVLISHNTFVDLITRASFDVHPPLYHILLKIFINSGISEWTTRLLSALAGIGSVYLIYIFVSRLFNDGKNHTKQVAIVSALLFTISPYLIYPFQEARMYALFLFLSLGSYYFFLKLTQDSRTSSVILESKAKRFDIGNLKILDSRLRGNDSVSNVAKEKSNWKTNLAYIIFTVLTLYTHYLGFVLLSSQLIYFLIFNRQNIKTLVLSWVGIILLFLPQLSTMISQFSARVSEQSQALSITENIKGLIGALYRFGAGRLFLDVSPTGLKTMMLDNPVSFLAFIITLVVPVWLFIKGLLLVHKNYKNQFWFLVTPMTIAIILAIFSTEIGSRSSRYLIYIYSFYLIFVAFGFLYYFFPVILEPEVKRSDIGNLKILDSRIRGNDIKIKWTILIPILFLTISISGLIYHYQFENLAPGVNKIAKFVSQKYQDGDIVLIRGGFGGGESWVFRHYFKSQNVNLKVYDMFGNYKAGNLAQLKSINPKDKIDELLNVSDYNRVWFYDMTYETDNIPDSQKHSLGNDKEKKELLVWEVTK